MRKTPLYKWDSQQLTFREIQALTGIPTERLRNYIRDGADGNVSLLHAMDRQDRRTTEQRRKAGQITRKLHPNISMANRRYR